MGVAAGCRSSHNPRMRVRLTGAMVGIPSGKRGDVIEVTKLQGERLIKNRAAVPVTDADAREDGTSKQRRRAQRA